ncbi:hypothetical protein Rrhod_2361 [Rhodococcus rhodnii LMG 5362]|uniref:Uncharacterized protein n=1 Tax=Rhodococcus rhodnii LMG 5362 TaxID=1273125 RepID=R7WLR5_9NOCA|nr:hypothetical protein Rrhod_2361 [Rhodococcus rhodnii LMG 5362]
MADAFTETHDVVNDNREISPPGVLRERHEPQVEACARAHRFVACRSPSACRGPGSNQWVARAVERYLFNARSSREIPSSAPVTTATPPPNTTTPPVHCAPAASRRAAGQTVAS